MYFLKKNSARPASCKNKKKTVITAVAAVAAVVGLIALTAAGWHYLPVCYARFYLARSALQTQGIFKELWGDEKGEGDAYESFFKLVADEAFVNGKSVLVLPGGLGISFTEQRNMENTFVQGKIDVYFLGAIRDGAQYWADSNQVVIQVPQISAALVKTTQADVNNQIGVSPIPQKKQKVINGLKQLEQHIIDMIRKSRVTFTRRDKTGVTIRTLVPAELFDSVLMETGELLEEVPGKESGDWSKFLKERRTEGENQEILFSIRKDLSISQVVIPELAYVGFQRLENQGALLSGQLTGTEGEISFSTTVYFGNGNVKKRTFQIKELNMIYDKKDLDLKLKLSGGYEGGRISSGILDQGRLAAEEQNTVNLSELKEKFMDMIKVLGMDIK